MKPYLAMVLVMALPSGLFAEDSALSQLISDAGQEASPFAPPEVEESPMYEDGFIQETPADNGDPGVTWNKSRGGGPGNYLAGLADSSSGLSADLPAHVRAFLDTLAYAEGTHKAYNLTFTHVPFYTYSDHPRRKICTRRYCSTAAGCFFAVGRHVGPGNFYFYGEGGFVKIVAGVGPLRAAGIK